MNKLTNFEIEHEFRWHIPLDVFRQILASPNKPVSIVRTYRIEQLWTYTSPLLKTRVRKMTTIDNGDILLPCYTACTKYRLSSTDEQEFEMPINEKEYVSVLRLFDRPLERKTRVAFVIRSHSSSSELWTADLYDGSSVATIECEALPGTKPEVPDWIVDNDIRHK